MNSLPLVSIITPSLNQARFIEETILSVKRQDYPNIEHIVIDGGSTDGTLDILRKYDKEIIWISEPDKGQSDAINKGIRLARGEIIGWLNSDDTYELNAVRIAVEHFLKYPNAAVIYGDCNIIDDKGRLVRHRKNKPFNLKDAVMKTPVQQPESFIRKHVLEDIGMLDLNLQYSMDYDLWIRIGLREYTFIYIPYTLANFRLHAESKSQSDLPFKVEPFEKVYICDKLLRNSEISPEVRAALIAEKRRAIFNIAYMYYRNANFQESRKYLIRLLRTSPPIREYKRTMILMMKLILRQTLKGNQRNR